MEKNLCVPPKRNIILVLKESQSVAPLLRSSVVVVCLSLCESQQLILHPLFGFARHFFKKSGFHVERIELNARRSDMHHRALYLRQKKKKKFNIIGHLL